MFIFRVSKCSTSASAQGWANRRGDFTINIFNNLSFIVQFGGFYDVWASAPVESVSSRSVIGENSRSTCLYSAQQVSTPKEAAF